MRALRWFLMNGFFALCVWYGVVKGVDGASNVALFIAWTCFISSLFITTDDAVKYLAEKGRSIPQWLDVSFDLAITFALVWHGYTITGAAYAIHMIMLLGAWGKVDKLNAEGV